MLYVVSDSIVYSDITMDFFEAGNDIIELLKSNNTEELQISNNTLKNIKERIGDINTRNINISKDHIFNKLGRLTLIMTNNCNFKCTYCYEDFYDNGKLNNNELSTINTELCIKYIKKLKNIYKNIETLCFFGGEPLLEFEKIAEICEHVTLIDPSIHFTMITNGSIYNNKIKSLLKLYNFNITVSMDGPEFYHNKTRIMKNNCGSYNIVSNNIKKMLNDGIPISIQGTLTIDHIDNNFGIIEFAKYIKDKYNISNIHIVPAQYNINDTKNWSNDLLEKLINSYSNYDIYNIEQILKGNFNNILYSSSFFDMLISLIVKRYNPLVCPSGTELTISTDGNLFPCFMLVNKTNIAPLGNLQIQDEEIKDNIHKYLVSVLKNNIASCNSCFAKNICHGCAGANLNESGNICHPSRVLCELTKERIKK